MILVSTTYRKEYKSDLLETLNELNLLDIDGIEIGSTHNFLSESKIKKILNNFNSKKLFIHNFFPPIKNDNFVINPGSLDNKVRGKSIDFIINSIDFSSDVGADLYTFHPGFLSPAVPNSDLKNKNFDFNFSKNLFSAQLVKDNFIRSLKKIVPYATKKKIKIAIETQGSFKKNKYLTMQLPNEFNEILRLFPNNLYINFNLAHSFFSSRIYKFSLINFIKKFKSKFYCVEISHNNGKGDQHMSLKDSSYVIYWLKHLKKIPKILEFRDSNIEDIKKSIQIVNKYEN
jgi:sugar phosphate isomerase/epimerase